jgi:hypothetical protein
MMKTTLKIREKKPWEVSKGHTTHISGAGTHDNRPKRLRTRRNQNHFAINEK